MKCPNCGRTVRSKTRCAFCGHQFEGSESTHVHESQDFHEHTPDQTEPAVAPIQHQDDVDAFIEANEVIPRTRRSGGFLRIIGAILKLALVILLVFLLIAFGPKYIGRLMDSFGSGNNPLTSWLSPETTTVEVTTVQTTVLEETSQETTSQAVASDLTADTSAYPLTVLSFEVDPTTPALTRDQIEVGVSFNGQDSQIQDYALVQDGNRYTVSFNNPALGVVASDQPEQTAYLKVADLGIEQSVVVALPDLGIDTEKVDTYNQILSDNLADQGSLTAAFADTQDPAPFIYDNQSRNASQTFAWFILARTYQAIEDGELNLSDEITILDALKADQDPGLVATNEEGVIYTLEELLTEMVENQDVTAMNHLIQANGGPNAFNLWLTENHYFATKVNELLGTNEEGHVTGTVTSTQDLVTLLSKLANNELISEEADTQIKDLLLKTPLTAKYPEGLEGVTRRYEIASNDNDSTSQNYAAILEGEETNYIFVSLLDNVSDPAQAVQANAQTLGQFVTYAQTGETDFELVAEETTQEETSVEETVAQEVVTQAPPVYEETTTSRFTYGEDTDGDGLPNTVYDENWGSYRSIRWTRAEDGLFYFEYAE
ncbi:TPA: serine hydrolase [Streptococcus suis]